MLFNTWGIALITTFVFEEPVSPCCVGDQCELLNFPNCSAAGGTWLIGIDSCDPNPCLASYACCTGDDICQVLALDECVGAGGEWLAGIDGCDPNPCLAYACCLERQCEMLRHQDCAGMAGDWLIGVDSCDPNPCIQPTGA